MDKRSGAQGSRAIQQEEPWISKALIIAYGFLWLAAVGSGLLGYDLLGFLGLDPPPTEAELALEHLEEQAPLTHHLEQQDVLSLFDEVDALVDRLGDVR